jgi:hypothetical protein
MKNIDILENETIGGEPQQSVLGFKLNHSSHSAESTHDLYTATNLDDFDYEKEWGKAKNLKSFLDAESEATGRSEFLRNANRVASNGICFNYGLNPLRKKMSFCLKESKPGKK